MGSNETSGQVASRYSKLMGIRFAQMENENYFEILGLGPKKSTMVWKKIMKSLKHWGCVQVNC